MFHLLTNLRLPDGLAQPQDCLGRVCWGRPTHICSPCAREVNREWLILAEELLQGRLVNPLLAPNVDNFEPVPRPLARIRGDLHRPVQSRDLWEGDAAAGLKPGRSLV